MTPEDEQCLDLLANFIPVGVELAATMGLLIFFKELVVSFLYRPIRFRKIR